MLYILLNLLLLGAVASSKYMGLSLDDRLALKNLLMGGEYYQFPVGPSPRDLENTATNAKVVIPPLTFIAGGTGEGVQHLGAEGNIPNRQNPIPEVSSQYDNPPNPCPPAGELTGKIKVYSKVHRHQVCACEKDWDAGERRDCTAAPKCCLPNMPNEADFVNQYQLSERALKNRQIFSQTRNKYSVGSKRSDHMAKKSPVYKRSTSPFMQGEMVRHVVKKSAPIQGYVNPYIYNQPRVKSVVAKKAPVYSGAKPIM